VSGSTVQEISFTSIPSTYTDLILVCNARSQRSATTSEVYAYLNSDGGNNYSRTRIWSNGSAAYSDRNTNQGLALFGEIPAASATSGVFGVSTLHLMNYSNTTTNKTLLSRNGFAQSTAQGDLYVNLWRSTAAISTISIYNTSASYWVIGSTFTLYGVKSA
jgi:hypothetical protein